MTLGFIIRVNGNNAGDMQHDGSGSFLHREESFQRFPVGQVSFYNLRFLRHIFGSGITGQHEGSHIIPPLDQLAADRPAQESRRAGHQILHAAVRFIVLHTAILRSVISFRQLFSS